MIAAIRLCLLNSFLGLFPGCEAKAIAVVVLGGKNRNIVNASHQKQPFLRVCRGHHNRFDISISTPASEYLTHPGIFLRISPEPQFPGNLEKMPLGVTVELHRAGLERTHGSSSPRGPAQYAGFRAYSDSVASMV